MDSLENTLGLGTVERVLGEVSEDFTPNLRLYERRPDIGTPVRETRGPTEATLAKLTYHKQMVAHYQAKADWEVLYKPRGK